MSTASSFSVIQAAARSTLLILCFFAGLTGCARLGERMERVELPPGAPSVEEILRDLNQNEQSLKGFRATGTIILQSPELESTQVSRESVIVYQAPLSLHVVGRKYGTRVVELICSGDAFLLLLPTEKQYCYKPLGEQFSKLTTGEMAREIFQPEIWSNLPPDRVRLVGFYPESGSAELEIRYPEQKRRRLVKVQGLPWVVLENRLYDARGNLLAETLKRDYYVLDGIRFPREVESRFPSETAWMKMSLRKIELNPPLENAPFERIGALAEDAERAGYVFVERTSELSGEPQSVGMPETWLDDDPGGE
ncbi:MAG TPA: hypothetical protein PLO53_10910 [Candidatus Hydrogenedentes bacterium]|nr:hypothetical protein [Candidatus Hydrogenedentota bacterium]